MKLIKDIKQYATRFNMSRNKLKFLIPFYGYYIAFMKPYMNMFDCDDQDDIDQYINMNTTFCVILAIYNMVWALYIVTTIINSVVK